MDTDENITSLAEVDRNMQNYNQQFSKTFRIFFYQAAVGFCSLQYEMKIKYKTDVKFTREKYFIML